MKRVKILKVIWFPQNQTNVPGIRVVGKWLAKFGFNTNDPIELMAWEHNIIIRKIPEEEQREATGRRPVFGRRQKQAAAASLEATLQ